MSTYVLRPLICHLTSFKEEFKQLITLEEEADLFLEKPLKREDLVSLLRLINLKV